MASEFITKDDRVLVVDDFLARFVSFGPLLPAEHALAPESITSNTELIDFETP